MADNDLKPMTDGDIVAPRADAGFSPSASLNTTGDANAFGSKTEQAKQTVKDYSSKYGAQATDKIRTLADTGKERAVDGLGQLSQLITDAAAQVDDKLGAQYGDYARSAAGAVNSLSDQIKGKDVEELIDDARAFVRKSPGVAVGVAAALGFVIARVIQSGVDGNATGGTKA